MTARSHDGNRLRARELTRTSPAFPQTGGGSSIRQTHPAVTRFTYDRSPARIRDRAERSSQRTAASSLRGLEVARRYSTFDRTTCSWPSRSRWARHYRLAFPDRCFQYAAWAYVAMTSLWTGTGSWW